MKITRHNYETFLIDHIDGNLDAETRKELLLFLEQNPDIKNEFENLEDVTISAGDMKMPGKSELKKADETISEFDKRCIAFIENDMSEREKLSFAKESFLNEEKSRTLKIFSLTKLTPDTSIVFPDKESLKKSVPAFRRAWLYTSISAAAGILLITGFFALNRNPEPGTASMLAQSELSFDDVSIKIQKNVPSDNTVNEPVKNNDVYPVRKKENTPLHQPDFIAVQMPDEKINEENDNKKVIKQDNKENKDTTENLIIPNELLLKQNEKLLANNNTIKKAEKKSGFLYYVEQGVKGFRSLTGKNVDLDRQVGKDGKTEQFAFNIGKFKVSHTKAK